jgi:hypothetical protein
MRQAPPSGILIDEEGRVLEPEPAAATAAEPDSNPGHASGTPGRFDPGAVITKALQAAGLMK